MNIEQTLANSVKAAVKELFSAEVSEQMIQIQKTKKEFEGDFTIVVFPFLKISKKSPEETAKMLGEFLSANESLVSNYNVIK